MPRLVIWCGCEPDDARAVERDVALVGPVDAGDQVEERRLAGAVRADHRDDLALVDVQVEPVDDLQAAERERDALQLQKRHQTISTRRSPSRPFGRRIISAIRIRPSTMYRAGSGFDEHHVLPDERREVERRHEQRRAARRPRSSVRRARRRSGRCRQTGGIQRAEVRRHDHPVVDDARRSRPGARRRPSRESIAPAIACSDEAEHERRDARRARARASGGTRARAPTDERDEEDDARLARVAQQLEQRR